jgi:hypothetical protein
VISKNKLFVKKEGSGWPEKDEQCGTS